MKRQLLYLTICVSLLISCKGVNSPEGASESTYFDSSRVQPIAEGSIVYVELDSLTENYIMTIDLAAELEEKMNKMETDLNNRQRRFQTSVDDFNYKNQRGLETRARLQEIAEELGREEQNLAQLVERYRMEMAEEQMVMQRKILQAIMDYLKEYNREKGYKYILGNAFDAKILYADPSLNITAEVLDGINAKYRAEKR